MEDLEPIPFNAKKVTLTAVIFGPDEVVEPPPDDDVLFGSTTVFWNNTTITFND